MMNIYQRINEVRKLIGYIKKDSEVGFGTGTYKAVSHDNVVALVRDHLIDQGIVIEPMLIADRWSEPRKEKSTNWLYEGFYRISFINVEDPQDRAIIELTGHANDSGDKAPGKAVSYATKTAILKMFNIETGVDDESRNYDPTDFTEEQKATFDDLIAARDSFGFFCYMTTQNDQIRTGLFNSGADGEKTKLKKICRELESEGNDKVQDLVNNMKQLIDENDPAVLELIDEMEGYEKITVNKRLRDGDAKFIRQLQQGVS